MSTHARAIIAIAFAAAFVASAAASTSIAANATSTTHRKLLAADDDDGGWSVGTATWYGGPDGPGPDGMSIYTGSCRLGRNLPSHYVSAINTDGGYDYGLTNLCGQCYEVMCVAGRQRGLSESLLGPWAGCIDSGAKSVTVMITDSCPCHHSNPSNQRWCCTGEGPGSARHLDLSYLAFDAIAIRHRGVVDVKFRKVNCAELGAIKYYS